MESGGYLNIDLLPLAVHRDIFERWTLELMKEDEADPQPPKILINFLLWLVSMVAIAPLCYQLPRWGRGLDPMFVHPSWIEKSSFPFVYYLAAGFHPVAWILIAVISFAMICHNYGWSLKWKY